MLKILIWGICGAIVYMWLRKKMGLGQPEEKTTIHHHHYSDEKNKNAPQKKGDDYIDYEEVK